MGDYYPRYQPFYNPPTPETTKPTTKEKDLLCHYHMLRVEISNLEEIIGDEKELDKAVVLLKTGCKLIKKRLRKIGFKGPLREPAKSPQVTTSLQHSGKHDSPD